MPKTDPLSRLMKLEADVKALMWLFVKRPPDLDAAQKQDEKVWREFEPTIRKVRQRLHRKYYGKH